MPDKYSLRSLSRHDIDREIPRTPKEIYELNRMMAGKMRETFGENVVIVPSIG
jgi:endopolyphosphatase